MIFLLRYILQDDRVLTEQQSVQKTCQDHMVSASKSWLKQRCVGEECVRMVTDGITELDAPSCGVTSPAREL